LRLLAGSNAAFSPRTHHNQNSHARMHTFAHTHVFKPAHAHTRNPHPQNLCALIPLALLLGCVTEDLALRLGQVIGGLLNASLGNVSERTAPASARRARPAPPRGISQRVFGLELCGC
jgi:hypothetical protein